jgi:hypothetical protein
LFDSSVILSECIDENWHSDFRADDAPEVGFGFLHGGASPAHDHRAVAPVSHVAANAARGAVEILDGICRREGSRERLRQSEASYR